MLLFGDFGAADGRKTLLGFLAVPFTVGMSWVCKYKYQVAIWSWDRREVLVISHDSAKSQGLGSVNVCQVDIPSRLAALLILLGFLGQITFSC